MEAFPRPQYYSLQRYGTQRISHDETCLQRFCFEHAYDVSKFDHILTQFYSQKPTLVSTFISTSLAVGIISLPSLK